MRVGTAKAATTLCVAWAWPVSGWPHYHVEEECPKIYSGNQVGCGSPMSLPCFDRSRCLDKNGQASLTVFVHDDECSAKPSLTTEHYDLDQKPLDHWPYALERADEPLRLIARDRGVLAATPEDACIIIYNVIRGNDQRWWKSCILSTSTWDGGRNHLLYDLTDSVRSGLLVIIDCVD